MSKTVTEEFEAQVGGLALVITSQLGRAKSLAIKKRTPNTHNWEVLVSFNDSKHVDAVLEMLSEATEQWRKEKAAAASVAHR